VASQRLFAVFVDKFQLLEHLHALKNFLLLGHGDFVDTLMDALGPSLAKPANTLYRHILTATLEGAVRSSSAARDGPDVLRRLDARMLEYAHGELGWDVFTLEYRLDAPIDAIVDPDAAVHYKQLFAHLWKLRRIERALAQAWTRVVGGTRIFAGMAGQRTSPVTLGYLFDDLSMQGCSTSGTGSVSPSRRCCTSSGRWRRTVSSR
jgi:gamma-tubulin complex component 3